MYKRQGAIKDEIMDTEELSYKLVERLQKYYACLLYTSMETVVTNAKIMLDKTPDLLPALKKAKVVDSGGCLLYTSRCV